MSVDVTRIELAKALKAIKAVATSEQLNALSDNSIGNKPSSAE